MKHLYTKALVCLCLPVMLLACRNESTQEVGMYTGYEFPDTATVVKTAESNLYFKTILAGTITSYYLKGYDSVPFITASTFATLWKMITTDSDVGLTQTDSAVTITRTDTTPNVSLTIDAAAQTFSSANFMQFCTAAAAFNNGCMLAANGVDGFCAVKDANATTASTVTFDINTTYGLKMYPYTDSSGNKEILMPAQLAGLILCSANVSLLSYNGKNYYINPTVASSHSLDLSDPYFAGYGRGGTRTRAEAEFNYRLLCMLFDKYYSLQHLRTRDMNNGFNTFVYSNDLDQRLLSADPAVYDDALVKALMTYVDDGHTFYLFPSYYEDASEIPYYKNLVGEYQGPRYKALIGVYSELKAARKAAFAITDSEYAGGLRYINNPDTNTPAIAVITFDGFNRSADYSNYYAKKSTITAASPEALAKTDSFELFYNALSTIKADYPGIKNIIIDESCNGGGIVDACVYLASIFIKNAKFCYRNNLDGTQITLSYDVDTDLDGSVSTVTDWDLSSYHIYVLTSEFSFSCGNMFPSMMKEQRDSGTLNVASIRIIGKQSGGGGAIVLPVGTGDGAMFNTSSANEMTYTDGTSVDGGIPVDLALEHSVFYNDTAMYNALEDAYGTNF